MTIRPTVRALLGGALLVLGACGRGDSVKAQGPYAKDVNEIVPRIEQRIGLRFRTPPRVETRTKEQVRQYLVRQFDEKTPAAELAAEETTYKLLGLIPDTMDLRKFEIDLLTEQIVGFYDPATKILYIVDGTAPELRGVIMTHELVHALQDQYINLDSIQRATGDDDRQAAAQAVMEGQAMYEQMSIMAGGDIMDRLPGGWPQVREMIRQSQSSMPIFAGAPLLIQETLIFPYLSGAEWMRTWDTKEPGKVPYRDMPISTEQIIEPDRYFATPRDEPTRIVLPAPSAGTETYSNDLGEFETRILLYQFLHDQAVAIRGASGWDGDRYELVRLPQGNALAWLSVWDTPEDATDFFGLLGDVAAHRFGSIGTTLGETSKRFGGHGRTVVVRSLEVGGRPAVLWTDVPAGAPTALIDPAKVRLEPER